MRIGVSALAMRGRPEGLDSGIARYCFALIDALLDLESDHEFVVFVSGGFEAPERWRRHARCEIVVAAGVLARYKTLWEWWGAQDAGRRARCDVWFSTAHALPAGADLPTVLSVQDLFTFSHPQFYTLKHRWVVGAALRRAIAGADRLLAISEHTAAELEAQFDVPADRVTVTPLGLGNQPAPMAAAAVETAELETLGVRGRRFVWTLSTIEPRKNLPRLFEAFARLVEDPAFSDLRLVVAGNVGWKTGPSFERPRQLGIETRVDFVGYVPDDALPKLFAACEGFVLPSLIEGFGLPLLEALAHGVPVACSRTGSLPEVGGDLPIYFDPMSVEAITAGLRELLTSEVSRADFAERARARAAGFRWSATAAGTLQAIEAAVGEAS